MKKVIILIIAILMILSLLGMFYMTNRKLTKEQFISLMKSFEQISNVKLEGSTTKYIKDEIMLSVRNDGLHTWVNAKTKESIGYFPNMEIYSLLNYEESDSTGLENSEYTFVRI